MLWKYKTAKKFPKSKSADSEKENVPENWKKKTTLAQTTEANSCQWILHVNLCLWLRFCVHIT